MTSKPLYSVVTTDYGQFYIYPYGAIMHLTKDDEGKTQVHHIGRFELETYKEIIEEAIKKRNQWRKENGKD